MVTRTPFISITLNRKRLLIFVPLICCLPPPATPFQKSRDCFLFLFLGTFSTLSWFRKEKRRFISFIGRSSSSVNDVTWINTKTAETGGTWPCEDLDSSSRQFWSYIRRSFIFPERLSHDVVVDFTSSFQFFTPTWGLGF